MARPNRPEETPPAERLPKPRLWWLAAFHVAVIALVVALARQMGSFRATGPLLEDELRELTRSTPILDPAQSAAWGQRGWVVAVVAMVSALLLMLPIAWAYVATRESRKVDRSVVTTITLLPIAVAAILVIVQDSLAVAFSLAGIAGLVRFRNALDDTKDAMYVFVAIAVGLGAGVGALEAAAALSGLFNLVVIALWKWNRSQPVIADIALGEDTVPPDQSVLQTLLPSKNRDRHPSPVIEWFAAEESKPLTDSAGDKNADGKARRDGILRVRVADDVETRRAIEGVLSTCAKRWTLESDGPDHDGLPALTYHVRLKKRRPCQELLEALHERLGSDPWARFAEAPSDT